jgi:hypothetical protein
VPVVGLYALRSVRGTTRFRSSAPVSGTLAGDPPQAMRSVRIVEAEYRGRRIGVISEQRGRRLTAALACRVVAFSLLDPEAQERRLARWGSVLAAAANTAIHRLQWVERSAPSQGDSLARWLHEQRDPALAPRGTPMIESYLELIDSTAKVTQEHEILLAVQIDARRMRALGSGSAMQALVEQTERVAQGLQAADVGVLGALSAGQLARALRTAYDPYARGELAALDAVEPGRDGLAPANAWPLGTREAWDHYQSDGAAHATYWIAGWPRVEVSAMFMDAVLERSSVVRTIAVTFDPISPARSTREVEASITRDRADRELRQRFGQSETARQRQAQEATIRREAELAAGHAEVRLSGFVTVSGRNPHELQRACAEVVDQAARCHLELHRMYGQQADAFTFTLPLCRGLR